MPALAGTATSMAGPSITMASSLSLSTGSTAGVCPPSRSRPTTSASSTWRRRSRTLPTSSGTLSRTQMQSPTSPTRQSCVLTSRRGSTSADRTPAARLRLCASSTPSSCTVPCPAAVSVAKQNQIKTPLTVLSAHPRRRYRCEVQLLGVLQRGAEVRSPGLHPQDPRGRQGD